MSRTIDEKKLKQLFGTLFGKVEGGLTCALSYVGDRLGLYRSLAEAGATTSEDLARRTELDERWVREWLQQQAASGILEHDAGRFQLSPEAEEIFAREESPFFGAGIFGSVVGLMGTVGDLEESFRTGVGAPYDSFGKEFMIGTERTFAPFFRTQLVQKILPHLDGVVAKLEKSALVADVGCGAGVALVTMAKAFPRSEFHGYDNSRLALARAESHRRAEGLSNLTFHDTTHKRLPEDGTYDLITTFDCIHDMTAPAPTIRAIRRSLKPEGTWFVSDINGKATAAENVASHPLAGMLYGFSVLCCMRSALSVSDGAGLGTLGFPEDVARRMAKEAGFTRFTKHDLENPLNHYYEIRP